MAFWWVNHKQTRDHEVRGGYLWSPMRNANGAFNQTYENMKHVRAGDIVFSYANGYLGAVGQVTEGACASPKPTEFGNVGDYWSNEGWLVSVYFSPAPKPIRPALHIERIGPLLPARYSPIQRNGHGNQGCYLAGISDALGYILLAKLGIDASPEFSTQLFVAEPEPRIEVLADLHEINADNTIPETQRLQLSKARIGQGLFRKCVMLIDPHCKLTGVKDSRLLIASHIKPWRESNNSERISGYNGIMLSPHIDALFDDRLISFEDDGRMLTHSSLDNDVLERWSISRSTVVEPFRPEQWTYLDHHRKAFATRSHP
ncbi:MAG: HNH endonuclease [Xanthomonadales bacterium]|nr:HNH endonuclease [Xanthomonadales bacterium]